MRQRIDCFLPCQNFDDLETTVTNLRGSNIVNRIFLMVAEGSASKMAVPEGCNIIEIDNMQSAATMRKIGAHATAGSLRQAWNVLLTTLTTDMFMKQAALRT